MWETWVWSLGQKDPWRKSWQPTPVFLPVEFHGQRSLAGYSPWGHKELDTTEQLSLLTIYWRREWQPTPVFLPGKSHIYIYIYTRGGNGNLPQSSCLENPTDRGVWRATVHGVPRVGHDLETKPPPPLAIWPWPISSNHMSLSFFTWKMGPQYLLCFVAIRIKEKTNINQLPIQWVLNKFESTSLASILKGHSNIKPTND